MAAMEEAMGIVPNEMWVGKDCIPLLKAAGLYPSKEGEHWEWGRVLDVLIISKERQ
jgi:hypothetical protein